MAGLRKDGANPFLESTYAGTDAVLTGRRDPAKEKTPLTLTRLMDGGTNESKEITQTWMCEDPKSASNNHHFQVVIKLGPNDFSPHATCPQHPRNGTRRMIDD